MFHAIRDGFYIGRNWGRGDWAWLWILRMISIGFAGHKGCHYIIIGDR